MRSIINFLLLVTGISMVLAACEKVEDLPYYGKGTPVTLTTSTTAVAPTAADSTKPVVTFSWTDPKYGTDTSNYKYIVEIDSAGRGFSKGVTRQVNGQRTFSLTGRDLNAILLGFGFQLNKTHTLDLRVTSSYANNNEQYRSNVVQLTVTPFSDPSKLVTSATKVTGTLATESEKALTFSWSPSFVGYTGNVTYTLQYNISGGNFAAPKEIALGDNIYTKDMTKGQINETALNSGIEGGKTGTVDYRIKATTASGAVAYSNVVSVVVDTYLPEAIYPTLYMVGSINGNGWTNTTAIPIFRSETNPFGYTYTGYFTAGSFKLLGTLGQWAPMWGKNGDGVLQFRAVEGDPDPATIDIATEGYYTLTVDIKALTYSLVPYDASGATVYTGADAIGILGSFKSWDNVEPMTTTAQNPHIWETEYTFTQPTSELKFRIASGWSMNWGPSEENRPKLWGKGVKDGKNIIVPAGTYRILFNDLTGHYVFIKK